ncbi:ABC transporter ATP-binding protein [Aestuariimicrobium ganziense]|uniref:ABC transporter ATP-binding protein n=1 Tax=Aestuariimicrobium ganziense TaxID=2773677 RepID=UPI001A9B7D3E|nr:ABC transporter ATP-binding protein [Aestuariimicrobium ganziense]
MSRRDVGEVLLEVKDLTVDYLTLKGAVRAVDTANFTLRRGEILGVAGESGSGKSTLTTAILRLQRPPAVTAGGQVIYHHRDGAATDLVPRTDKELRSIRWDQLAIVMQSAMDALNPVKRLGEQFRDVLQLHNPKMSKDESNTRAQDLLAMSGIPRDRVNSYPHEMSGGMRQRSLISLALACDPDLVIMDEPTTAVDVVMQRTIMSQVLRLQRRLGFAIIFVTHDLSLLLELSDRLAIMYAGKIVEIGPASELYATPRHPYTAALRDSFPPLFAPLKVMSGIPGAAPDLMDLPPGCAFAPRCPRAMPICHEQEPAFIEVAPAVRAACLLNQPEVVAGQPTIGASLPVAGEAPSSDDPEEASLALDTTPRDPGGWS